MENKYYTPNPEDIRIGFEYEFHGMTTGGLVFFGEDRSKDIEPSIKIWSPSVVVKDIAATIFEGGQDFKTVLDCLERNQIRVPYLTAEQIEKEGWKVTKNPGEEFEAQKIISDYTFYDLNYDTYTQELNIEMYNQTKLVAKRTGDYDSITIFRGKCPSINEFRTVLRLLEI